MDRIIISTARFTQVIKKKAIVYCKAEGSYSKLVLNDNQKVVISKNLSWLEDSISSPLFVRSHRSFLVNIEYINRLFIGEGKITLSKGCEIPLSRYNSKKVLLAIQKLSQTK